MSKKQLNTADPVLAPATAGSGIAGFFTAILGRIISFFSGSGSLEKRKAKAGWVFVLPFVIGILFVYTPVILNSLQYSFFFFEDVIVEDPDTFETIAEYTEFTFAGLHYYSQALFSDVDFVRILVSGITQLIIDIPAIVIFSLFVAVILNQKMLGRAAFRAIFFIPVILSTGLIDAIDASNPMVDHMGSSEGIDTGTGSSSSADIVDAVDIENLFSGMKVGTEIVEYVVGLVNDIYAIVNRSGVQILIFLAGLQSISPSIYEACTIDGATAWETFWKITFPMISPMILVNSLYTIIDSFTSASNGVMTYIAQKTDQQLATAMAWIYFVLIMLIIVVFLLIFSAFVFYQKRDA